MELHSLSSTTGEWLRGEGPESDIVISTRIRLARNLRGRPFPPRAGPEARGLAEAFVRERVRGAAPFAEGVCLELARSSELDRKLLVERHLISRELANAEGQRSVAFTRDESTSVMINEEDHLRIQVIRSGMQLAACWEAADRVEHALGSRLDFAFDDAFGYLTSCPTNVGTGMRVSVMLHLPALVLTKQMERVFEAMSKISLAVRGLFGEGTSASGDFYQISNQVTLGFDEAQLLGRLNDVIPKVIEHERHTRDALLADNRVKLEDRVWRALGVLRTARRISSEETMETLSSVRLGVNLGLLPGLSISTINMLFILTQPAHLQKLEGRPLATPDRNERRARFIREHLGAP